MKESRLLDCHYGPHYYNQTQTRQENVSTGHKKDWIFEVKAFNLYPEYMVKMTVMDDLSVKKD